MRKNETFRSSLRAAPVVVLPSILLLLALGTGCRREVEAPATIAHGGEAQQGGTVAVATTADIAGVNEVILTSANSTNDVLFRVFDHLLEEQPDFTERPPEFLPQLATAWEFSDDRRVVTVHLHPQAVWSDGAPITADDVRFTWEVQRDPRIAWSEMNAKKYIKNVEVVDPKTVRFHFEKSYAKQLLDLNEGVILPKHAWSQLPIEKWKESGDWFRDHLVSSGPFTIASWKPQQEVVLARNERYYEPSRRARLDRAVIRVVPDAASQLAQLKNGEIQVATNVQPADVKAIRDDSRFEVRAVRFRNYVVVAWNNERALFSDPDVRRALTLAIDRQQLVDALWGEFANIAAGPILSFVWAHDKSIGPLPYAPQEARKILEAKGFRDGDGDGVLDRGGKPFRFELATNAGNQQRIDATVMIQEQLKRIGVAAVPRVVEFNALSEQVDEGAFDAVMLGLGMDTSLDLTTMLGTGGGNNIPRFSDPEVDRLLAEAATQPDIAATVPRLHEIEAIVARKQPFTFLWESRRLLAHDKRVREIEPTLVWVYFNLREWWLAPNPAE